MSDFSVNYAFFNGADWIRTKVAGGVTASTVDLAFGANGQPLVAFDGSAGRLVVAERAPAAVR